VAYSKSPAWIKAQVKNWVNTDMVILDPVLPLFELSCVKYGKVISVANISSF